jgi:hypothetical protein
MFYDTSTLQFNEAGKRVDLTTDEGRRWFMRASGIFSRSYPLGIGQRSKAADNLLVCGEPPQRMIKPVLDYVRRVRA